MQFYLTDLSEESEEIQKKQIYSSMFFGSLFILLTFFISILFALKIVFSIIY